LELVASFQFTSPMADEEAVTADLLGSTDLASIPELWVVRTTPPPHTPASQQWGAAVCA